MSERSAGIEAAIAQGRWADALELLDGEPDAGRSPALLELRAQAAYGNGDFEASIAAWEAQHGVLCEADDLPGAARAAAMVAMFLMIDTGLMAPVRGWLRRAERLLDGHDEGPVHAVVAAVRTYERFMCGGRPAAGAEAAVATRCGPPCWRTTSPPSTPASTRSSVRRGVKLSGGQIQRAAARMLLRGAELLVLDDLSSALDVATEAELWRRLLDRRGRGRLTRLVVSHSPIALGNADQVVVLDGGRAAGRPALSRSP